MAAHGFELSDEDIAPAGQIHAFNFFSGDEHDEQDDQEASDSDVQVPAVVPVQLKSKRNGERRAHQGHIYVSPKVFRSDGVTYSWRCQYKLTCKGRLHTNGLAGEVIQVCGVHNHDGQQVKVEAELFKQAVKRRAGETLESVEQILGGELREVPRAVQEQGPSKDALRQIAYRARKEELNAPANPRDRQSIVVPDQFSYYVTGGERERFLLIDSGEGDPDRILVFGRQSAADQLQHIRVLYIDATFSVSPPLFAQLLVIVGRRGAFAQPLFHVLMPDRKEVTYNRLFDMLLESYPALRPHAVCLDFELALINCVKRAFPNARLSACYFHLAQVVIRHLTGGLKAAYETELEFGIEVRMILALAFVPGEKLIAYLNALKQVIDARLTPLLEYFEDTYIGKRKTVRVAGRGKLQYKVVRAQPRYPHSMWQLHRRFTDGDDSTNNYVESAHNRLQRHLNTDHPHIWRFISAMHSVQRTFDFDFHQHNGGAAQPRKKRCSILSRNGKIRSIVEEIDEREPLDYLRSIACRLSQ